jgi:hypothetical protein
MFFNKLFLHQVENIYFRWKMRQFFSHGELEKMMWHVMNRQGLATISESSESYDSQDVGSNDRRDVGKVGSLGGPGHI